MIKFFDLNKQLGSIGNELEAAYRETIHSGMFILGEAVERFEKEFARYLGVKHFVALDSGTSALELSLLSLGVGPGDEVITTSYSFISTALAITAVGAKPVFVDSHQSNGNIDPVLVERAVTKRTKAVIPVHLFGNPCDMDPLGRICDEKDLFMVEDACQAHGATFKGRKMGSFGDVNCFSFYPTKNLGALGDAGGIATDDADVAEKVRASRNYGQREKYVSASFGMNHRMDEIQARILLAKLKHLDSWNGMRRKLAEVYNQELENEPVWRPTEIEGASSCRYLYPIALDGRDELADHLNQKGIGTLIHYPIPIHKQPVYASKYSGLTLPVAEKLMGQVISLPIYPELEKGEIVIVCDEVKNYLGTR